MQSCYYWKLNYIIEGTTAVNFPSVCDIDLQMQDDTIYIQNI